MLLGTVAPYLLAVATFGAWTGGYSPPARFLTVVAPLLAYYVAAALMLGVSGLTWRQKDGTSAPLAPPLPEEA